MNDKTARQLAEEERNKIPVEVIKSEDVKEEDDNEEKEDDEKDEADDKSDEDTKGHNEDDKSGDTDTDDDGEDKEEKTDKEKLAAEAAEAKEKRKAERVQRRIDKAVASEKAAKEELEVLKKQLADTPDKKLSEDDAERLAELKANEKVMQREFIRDCNKLADDAEKVNKDFSKHIGALTEEIGAIPSQMIAILTDIDNGGEVLNYLSNIDNVDEAELIWKLPTAKMALRLARLSDKLIASKKKPHKEISNLPEPGKPLGGKQNSGVRLHDKMPMKDWVEQREREIAERKERKRAALR